MSVPADVFSCCCDWGFQILKKLLPFRRITSNCGGCGPNVFAVCYQVDSAITDGSCTGCEIANGQIVKWSFSCSWFSPAPGFPFKRLVSGICQSGGGNWSMSLSPDGTGQLTLTAVGNSVVGYSLTVDCETAEITGARLPFFNGNCTWPLTLTLTPVECPE